MFYIPIGVTVIPFGGCTNTPTVSSTTKESKEHVVGEHNIKIGVGEMFACAWT